MFRCDRQKKHFNRMVTVYTNYVCQVDLNKYILPKLKARPMKCYIGYYFCLLALNPNVKAIKKSKKGFHNVLNIVDFNQIQKQSCKDVFKNKRSESSSKMRVVKNTFNKVIARLFYVKNYGFCIGEILTRITRLIHS